MHVVGKKTLEDVRANTSAVIVTPGAGAAASKAMRNWAAQNPEHAQWLLDGHPTMTEDEHLERFGEPYERRRSR